GGAVECLRLHSVPGGTYRPRYETAARPLLSARASIPVRRDRARASPRALRALPAHSAATTVELGHSRPAARIGPEPARHSAAPPQALRRERRPARPPASLEPRAPQVSHGSSFFRSWRARSTQRLGGYAAAPGRGPGV